MCNEHIEERYRRDRGQNMKECKRSRTAVLFLGSEIKSDDGAGPAAFLKASQNPHIQNLVKKGTVRLYNCGTLPENFLRPLREFEPESIIIVDACVMGEKPGCVKEVPLELLPKDVTSTHSPSFRWILEEMKKITTSIHFLGIQPEVVDLGTELSEAVKEGVEKVVETLIEMFL